MDYPLMMGLAGIGIGFYLCLNEGADRTENEISLKKSNETNTVEIAKEKSPIYQMGTERKIS
jgi:hypothetical protein